MQITLRDLLTVIHGMGFGALLLFAFPAALIEVARLSAPVGLAPAEREQKRLSLCLWGMAIVGWITVLMGTYVIYPWYRALPPAGTTNLALFPQQLLLASPATAEWHDLGMEWKEHIAWLVPIALTMVAYVFSTYRAAGSQQRGIRASLLTFLTAAFLAACVAGLFGAFLNKYAPVRGGHTITIMQGRDDEH